MSDIGVVLRKARIRMTREAHEKRPHGKVTGCSAFGLPQLTPLPFMLHTQPTLELPHPLFSPALPSAPTCENRTLRFAVRQSSLYVSGPPSLGTVARKPLASLPPSRDDITVSAASLSIASDGAPSFDLNSAPIPPELSISLPTHLGLHHHSEGTRAGYNPTIFFLHVQPSLHNAFLC
jgi:hypothetical protein